MVEVHDVVKTSSTLCISCTSALTQRDGVQAVRLYSSDKLCNSHLIESACFCKL